MPDISGGGMLGKQQVMPDAQALYEQQIIMAHESSQGAKQQLPQPIKSQHYPGGMAEASGPRIRARTPTPSERDKEGNSGLRALLGPVPLRLVLSPLPASILFVLFCLFVL